MSSDNVERARRLWDALARGEDETVFAGVLPDALFHVPPELMVVGDWRGPEGFRKAWLEFQEPFGVFRFEPEEFIERDDMVVAVVGYRAEGAGSHAEVEGRFYYVARWRNGKIAEAWVFGEREPALALAGLNS